MEPNRRTGLRAVIALGLVAALLGGCGGREQPQVSKTSGGVGADSAPNALPRKKQDERSAKKVVREFLGGPENEGLVKNAAIVTVCRMRLKDDGSPPDPGPPFAPRQREAPAPIIERKIENARPTVRRGQSEDDYDFDPFVSVSDQQAEEMRGILASLREDWLDYAKGCLPVYGVRVRFADEEGIVDVDLCFACDVLRVRRDGKPVWGEHIDTVRPGLVAFCKEVFSEDEEIQRLRPGR